MKLLQVVPDTMYFVWQLYVQMYNFRTYGIEKDAIILIALKEGQHPSPDMYRFSQWTEAKVEFIEDTRKSSKYVSTVRPHIIAKYLKFVRPLTEFFYHDSDIIFTSTPDISKLTPNPNHYVAPGAQSYLWSPYMKQFKKYFYPSMCELVGIRESLVEENDANCGGAQYVIKHTDYAFWEKVEKDSEALFWYCEDMVKHGLRKYKPEQVLEEYYIQYWCADMWALFWNLLLTERKVLHAPEIDFSWPWDADGSKPIFHNAGVTEKTMYVGDKLTYFNKGRYTTKYPFGEDLSFVPDTCSQKPYTRIIEALTAMGATQNSIAI